MPKYIDFHAKMPNMPPGALADMRRTLGTPDKDGVKNLNAYFTKDGQGYCISEAPNADAVCKSHAAHGVQINRGEVHEISETLT